jgi:hypothetical protein
MKYTVLVVALILISVALIAAFTVKPPPPAPTPSSNNPESVGICVHSLSQGDAYLVNESGARWIRIDISNNQTDLTNSLVNAKTYNLSVLGVLGSWMFNKSCNFTLDEWSRAVSSNVSKYAPYVDAWELWNEPASTQQGWQLQADYFSMVKIASPIIRQFDPTAKIVLLGGLQLYKGSPNVPSDDKEFADNLPKNITDYGDAISVHAYPWAKSSFDWESQYDASMKYYRGLFSNQSVEIWVTETGQNITDCGGNQQLQAQYLKDSLDFFQGKAQHVFWYALHDENMKVPDFGLVNTDSSSREAYNALHNEAKR